VRRFARPRSISNEEVSGTPIAPCSDMLTHRLLVPVLAACASLAAITGCTSDDDFVADASLLVVNDSDFVIEQIYLTDVGNPSFGPNLLAGDVLFPDEQLLLGVNCGFYDALIVDEDGVECEINDIDLCLNDATWTIRNNTCSVFGIAAKERAEKASAAKLQT
jgi:hypothetical protein